MEKFQKESLFGNDSSNKPSSLPLVLPNNVKYDSNSGKLTHTPGVRRTHLELVPSTVALLSKVQDPVAVVSIAGMARSGKSYILSRLLGSSDAFRLGHSMNPETFGIWIGTEVLKKDFTILLVDTEGIDSASAEKKNDISLLVLTILLSSYFIFNTLSVPKQAQLEELQCFVHLVNGLRVSREGSDDYSKFPTVFPDFLWLLRDVTLTPTDAKGNEIDARTFLLDRVLQPSGGFEEKPSDKVARALKMFFPSIDCMTLPPPSEDATIMQNIVESEEKLSPKFKAAVPHAIDHIFSKVKPKTGYTAGSQINGAQLACMLETYVNAVNDPGAIPVIETSWQTSLRMLAERFHNEAVELYKKGMTAVLEECGEKPLGAGGDDGITIVSLHRKYYTSAQELLRKGLGPMCNEVEQSTSLNRLQQAIFGDKGKNTGTENKSGLFHEYWRLNNEKSIKYCEKIRDQLWEPISKKISKEDNGYTYDNLREDLKRLEMEYRANAKGPAKEKVYGDFLKFVQSEEKAFSKVQDFKQEEFEEKQKALEINSRLEAIQEEQRRVEDMMVEEMEAHKQQAMKLNEEYNERIDKMKEEEKEAYIQRMREQMEVMQSTMTKNVATLQEMSTKNMKFIEDNLKMARKEADEQQKQMVEIVKNVQERNAKLAKDLAEQTKAKEKSFFAEFREMIPMAIDFIRVIQLFQGGAKTAASTTKKT